jgi:benzoyl-CoA reductase/2-hydroxyglutaryl-CoA dehydratase subunit BcrC/BadD/HgdB
VSATSKNYREDVPPVEAMARYVLDGQTAGAAIYLRQAIEKQVERVKAQGLVLYGFTGCSLETVSREMNKEYFQNKGIACIDLEGTFQPDLAVGQTQTRVRAFIEMLSQNRNLKEKPAWQ